MEQQNIDFEGLLKRKTKPKTEISMFPDLDNLQQITFDDDSVQDIVVPDSLNSQIEKQVIDEVVTKNKTKTASLLGLMDFFSKPVKKEEKQHIQQIVHEVHQQIPQQADIQEVVETIEEAIEQVPDAKKEIKSFDDIVVNVKKDKSGYQKLKVTVKGSESLSQLASDIKVETNGDVVHRAMDLRTITNTNKNQLKSSEYKLSTKSYVFKSKTSKRKYHRFIVSLQDNDEVVIFLQEAAEKYVTKLSFNNDLLVTLISKYFLSGINSTIARLKAFESGEDSEIINTAYKIANTGKYRIKVGKNGFAIKGKDVKYYWLYVAIIKQNSGKYLVYAKSTAEKSWKGYQLIDKEVELDFVLKPKFEVLLDDWFNDFDWSKIYDFEDEENNIFNMYKKLRYRKIKSAFDTILNIKDDNEFLGIEIIKTISREELSADEILGKWQPEAIVGKTNYLDVFALTWSAVAISGGNSRKRKSGDGTYDSRPFMFTLTYQKGDKVEEMLSQDFDELLKKTRFLTTDPKF